METVTACGTAAPGAIDVVRAPLAAAMHREVCREALLGTLLFASVEQVASEGLPNGDIVRDNVLIAVFLVLSLVLVVAGVVFIRHRHHLRELQDERNEEAAEAREWLYKDGSGVQGPFSNTKMRRFWANGIVNRSTKAKIVWWTQDFKAISELFPETGTEFSRPAKADGKEAHNSSWHRFSVLAQPNGPAAVPLNWYYQLPNGAEEGPFESGKMRHWFMTGFFDEHTLLRYEGAENLEFKPLKELFVNLPEAFDVLPNGCSAKQARKTIQLPPQLVGKETD